ncbi:MAG: hypothetical protein GC164_04060 [Phycisphaera sp.]|nr:hypothetical protein [Phycisphaera sp.]
MSGNNSHSGGTSATAGKLFINSATALGTGTFTLGALTSLDNTSGSAITNANNNTIAWNGDTTFSASNDLNLGTGSVTLGGNRVITITNAPGVLTLGGAIAGAFSISKGGGGTMAFTGTNSAYTGFTTINQGVLIINSLANVGGGNSSLGAPTTVGSGTISLGSTNLNGTLRYTGTGNSTSDRVIDLKGTTGGGTLDVSGTGSLLFSSNFTATGTGSKTLTLTGSNTGVGEIQGAIVNNSGTNTTALAKSGTGKWILSGTSTYTGATNVNGGTLAVNGSLTGTSAVTVAASGKLGGNGTINTSSNLVTINGTLASGNSIGTLNINDDLVINGTDEVELGTPGATPALGNSDRTVVTGGLTLGASSVLQLIDDANASSLGSAGAGAYRLITYTGSRSGTFTNVTNPLSSTLHEKVVYNGVSNGSVDLELYRLAAANTITTPVSLGIVHVGDTFSSSVISVLNNVLNDGYSEKLDAAFGTLTGAAATNGGSISLLGASLTDNTSMTVTLNDTATAGAKSGTALVSLNSNGSGTSGYGTTALTGQIITVNGQVNEYASPAFALVSGADSLTNDNVQALSYLLSFSGTAVASGSATLSLNNLLLAAGYQDTLSGTFDLSNLGVFNSGGFVDNFGPITEGNGLTGLTVSYTGLTAGVYNGYILFNPVSGNGSGDSNLSQVTLNIQANITAIPEPMTMALLATGLLMVAGRRGR